MAQKRKTDQRKVIIEAALACAGKAGWHSLTLQEIARKSHMKAADVSAQFTDAWEILEQALTDLHKAVAAKLRTDLSEHWRDNLFEILMTRLEMAGRHRPAFASITSSVAREPRIAPRFARVFMQEMKNILDLAGLPSGPLSPLHIAVFGALYISIIEAWKNDATPDLSKTMAVIDKRLASFEQFVLYTDCQKPPRRQRRF